MNYFIDIKYNLVRYLTRDYINVSLLFFSLSFQFRCSPCVSTDGICGWCQLDFTCTGDNSTCTGGHDNWIRVRPYNIKV